MRILTLGSLNFDFVYSLPHITLEGETISAHDLELKHGGKGLNQSVALARAGAEVFIAGCVGPDGEPLIDVLRQAKVNTAHIKTVPERSGHAIIQLADNGSNSIVIYSGANEKISTEMIDEVLDHFAEGDFLLMQNEISNVAYAMHAANAHGIKIAFNPSPVTEELQSYPLEFVDTFILNELEGQILSGATADADDDTIIHSLVEKFPHAKIVLTLGARGARYHDMAHDLEQRAYQVPVVDTTGAGDTFCGYFLACVMKGMDPGKSLEMASKASSLAIGVKGAAVSIPIFADVEKAKFDVRGEHDE